MTLLMTKSALNGAVLLSGMQERAVRAAGASYRLDRWLVLILIPIALIIAVGVLVAWWITCQNRGMYPALDFPSWNDGGTFKAYCKP